MNLIEQIKADREAGTPGPWHAGRDAEEADGRGWFVGGGGYCRANMVGPTTDTKVNARRIARVPDMEAALLDAEPARLAAEELAKAADSAVQNADSLGDYADPMVSMPLSSIRDLSDALAAYRKATGAAQ